MAEENKIPEVELDTDGVQEQSIEVNQEVKEPDATEIKKEDVDFFLNPKIKNILPDPFKLKDMDLSLIHI